MYSVYLDKILLPITPPKIQIKIGNQNKTYNLINDGACNLIKSAGLREISLMLFYQTKITLLRPIMMDLFQLIYT